MRVTEYLQRNQNILTYYNTKDSFAVAGSPIRYWLSTKFKFTEDVSAVKIY